MLLAGGAALLAGCTDSDPAPGATGPTGGSASGSASGSPTGPTGDASPTTPGSLTPTPSDSASPSPSASASPSPSGSASPSPDADAILRPGASGAEVQALQDRLIALGYWLGTPDGTYGNLTVQAVLALQKVARIGRDGVFGPKTRAALDRGPRPAARSTAGRVIEVDLARQVLLVVDGGQVRTVLNTSTGSGEWYTRPDGQRRHAVTPTGRYTVFRSVDGWDTSPLGRLYRPRYFNGGIAVHGYPSVPAYPASHGCVRLSLPAMDMIWREELMPRRGPVWVV